MCLSRGARASPSASLRIGQGPPGFPGGTGSSAAVTSAASTTRWPPRLVTAAPALASLEHARAHRSFSLPSVTQRLLDVVGWAGDTEGGREVVTSSPPEIGEFSGALGKHGVPSLVGVCAAQGGEARQGGGQGELPASPTGSL
jgi:hypothetical protein